MVPLKRSEEECAEGLAEAKVSAAHVAQTVIEKLGGSSATVANLRAARSVLLEAAKIVTQKLSKREASDARKKERAEKRAEREARQQERAIKREARKQKRANKQAKQAVGEAKGKRS